MSAALKMSNGAAPICFSAFLTDAVRALACDNAALSTALWLGGGGVGRGGLGRRAPAGRGGGCSSRRLREGLGVAGVVGVGGGEVGKGAGCQGGFLVINEPFPPTPPAATGCTAAGKGCRR